MDLSQRLRLICNTDESIVAEMPTGRHERIESQTTDIEEYAQRNFLKPANSQRECDTGIEYGDGLGTDRILEPSLVDALDEKPSREDRYARAKLKDMSVLTQAATPNGLEDNTKKQKSVANKKKVTRSILTARSRGNSSQRE